MKDGVRLPPFWVGCIIFLFLLLLLILIILILLEGISIGNGGNGGNGKIARFQEGATSYNSSKSNTHN